MYDEDALVQPDDREDGERRLARDRRKAIDMLSRHPDSDEFIEEYRRWRHTHGIVESLIFAGQAVQMANRGEQPPS
jgi:hypothetical protein